MKKILVPVDFSDHTHMTCSYALELAAVEPSEILLFNTYFDQIILTDTTFPDSMNMNVVYNEELITELHHQAEHSMAKLVEQLKQEVSDRNLNQVVVEGRVAGGDIEMELRSVCDEEHPHVVVMGSRGKGRNVHVWGRVTTHIINHARVPVITVPEISRFMGFSSVMFAADLSEGNIRAVTEVLEMLKPFGCQLYIVHFITRKENKDEKMKEVVTHFEALSSRSDVQFDLVMAEEDHQQALEEYIADYGIELIAFQPHKRSLFYHLFSKNITKKNLFSTNIPLLAIPVEE